MDPRWTPLPAPVSTLVKVEGKNRYAQGGMKLLFLEYVKWMLSSL